MKSPSQLKDLTLCRVEDLGRIDYLRAWNRQKEIFKQVLAGGAHCLLLCEHDPVVTLGRMATEEHFLIPPEQIRRKGVEICWTDRGGDVTLHSPGQLVVYPIFNLNELGRDLKLYLYQLEAVAMAFLLEYGIRSRRVSSQRGVWVGDRKIVSLGIGVKKWISYHGLAININTDLRLFTMIKPCGSDATMTSLQELTGQRIDIEESKSKIVRCFCDIFGLTIL